VRALSGHKFNMGRDEVSLDYSGSGGEMGTVFLDFWAVFLGVDPPSAGKVHEMCGLFHYFRMQDQYPGCIMSAIVQSVVRRHRPN
jgi:hypothetical protein